VNVPIEEIHLDEVISASGHEILLPPASCTAVPPAALP